MKNLKTGLKKANFNSNSRLLALIVISIVAFSSLSAENLDKNENRNLSDSNPLLYYSLVIAAIVGLVFFAYYSSIRKRENDALGQSKNKYHIHKQRAHKVASAKL